jgi:hypothetical protein
MAYALVCKVLYLATRKCQALGCGILPAGGGCSPSPACSRWAAYLEGIGSRPQVTRPGISGKARIRLDQRMEYLSAGDVVVIEPRENHHFESDRDEPCINLSLRCGPMPHPDQAG